RLERGEIAGVTVTGDRGHDDSWVDLTQRRIAETELLEYPGPRVRRDDIAHGHQIAAQFPALNGRNVDDAAALHQVGRREQGAVIQRRLDARLQLGQPERIRPLRRLDLEHVSAHASQPQRAVRAGDELREVNDADALERQRRHPTPTSPIRWTD